MFREEEPHIEGRISGNDYGNGDARVQLSNVVCAK